MNNPYEWLQNFIAQVPDILQPVKVALVGAIPYIEGEAAAAFGIIAGINPVVAAIAGATGNILCVIGVVYLGSHIRERAVARRAAKAEGAQADAAIIVGPQVTSSDAVSSGAAKTSTATVTVIEQPGDPDADAESEPKPKPKPQSKGRARLRRWLVRFGVPGASILAPIAFPTMLTAAFFVASGVPKGWVILWQVVAIILWTTAVAILATGALALLGW